MNFISSLNVDDLLCKPMFFFLQFHGITHFNFIPHYFNLQENAVRMLFHKIQKLILNHFLQDMKYI